MAVKTIVNGTPTKCMEQVFSLGMMDADTKVSTMTTRKKVVVFSPGLMDANTMDSGRTANSTVSVSIIPQDVMKRRASVRFACEKPRVQIPAPPLFARIT